MHRHGYKGRKFGRERDQRQALLSGLATSLFTYGKIQTTLPKAKDLVPFAEDLISKAKEGSLHSRRLILSELGGVGVTHKLVDEIAPKLKGRAGGHLRLKHTGNRLGDNAALAEVSFVDGIASTEKPLEKKEKVPKEAA